MMAEQNSDNLFTLPDDPEKLKLLVADYSRRLQNALHTVEAQKQTLIKNSIQHEEFSKKLNRANRLLELEIAKNVNLARRKQQDDESKRYERTRVSEVKFQKQKYAMSMYIYRICREPSYFISFSFLIIPHSIIWWVH